MHSPFGLPSAERFALPGAGENGPAAERPEASAHPGVEQERDEEHGAADPEMSRRRRINALRHQMHAAADREDYETAARLRDELRQLEG